MKAALARARRQRAAPPSAPRALPSPERQRFLLWVAACALAIVLFCIGVPLSATIYQLPVLGAFAVGILQSGSIPLAIIAPRWSIAGWAAGTSLFIAFGTVAPGAPWPLAVPGLLTFCGLLAVLGLLQPIGLGLAAWAIGAATSLQVLLYSGFGESKIATVEGVVANLVTTTAISAFALLLARLLAQSLRMRGELATERQQSAAEQQRRVLVEERNRIARELHDVVAHSMSVIQVQAASAPYRLPQLDDAARTEFGEIAASARAAMQEMRQLLGVLRSEDTRHEAMPQPGIRQLAELVPSIERAGVTVTLDIAPEMPNDGLAGTAAYRIAQESLSNVVRHAPGASASVRAELIDGAIVLCVENAAPPGVGSGQAGERGRTPTGGHGLIGMRERCGMLGGALHAGPTADGGYRVLATLPIAASARHDGAAANGDTDE